MVLEPQIGEHMPQRLRAVDVARKVKSFDHFLYVWGSKANYYLPPRTALTWHYISQVLAGEKLLLRVNEVGHVLQVPKAKGMLVEDLWIQCKELNQLHAYLPDVTPRSHIPRTYFLNVRIIRSSRSLLPMPLPPL
jgi:hypothetical protein